MTILSLTDSSLIKSVFVPVIMLLPDVIANVPVKFVLLSLTCDGFIVNVLVKSPKSDLV